MKSKFIVDDLEMQLEAERRKLQAIFQGAESALVVFQGPDWIVEMMNTKYQAIYPNRDLLGKPLFSEVPELKSSHFPDVLKDVYETGEPYVSHEGLARIKNAVTGMIEERYFDTTFSRISFGVGTSFRIIATPREVTDRVLARKMIEDAVLKLKHERELREKFVSSVSHDLRNPLFILKILTDMLKKKAADPELVRSLADRMMKNINRSDRMIRDLLDANRIEAGEKVTLSLQLCRLEDLVVVALSDLEEVHGKRFTFINLPSETKGLWDSMAIYRIIENLASNAIKYGSIGGEVTVELKTVGPIAQISVHNVGTPIPLDEQELLFHQYHRSPEAINSGLKGWGIGLTIVQGLVAAHGGSVRVKSNLEQGTTFFVQLPIAKI